MNKLVVKWLCTFIVGCAVIAVTAPSVKADTDAKFNKAPPSKHSPIKPAKPPQIKGPMKIVEQLDLDPKKRALVQQIITEQHQKRMEAYQQSRKDRQNTQHKMGEIHQQTIERLSTVLSSEQVKQFQNMFEQKVHKKPMQHRKSKEIN